MKIFRNHNLKPYHTFGIDVKADEFIVLETRDDIIEFINRRGDRLVDRTLILGGGSNVLFTGDFHGTVVKIDTRGIEIIEEIGDEILIRVAAGEDWDGLVHYSTSRGWGGLENLSGIPGNAGSSPIQNIGAYGSELKDVFHSLKAFELAGGKELEFNLEDCRFGYRDSIFKRELKGKVIITEIILRLNKKAPLNLSYQALAQKFDGIPEREINIQKVRDAVLQIRASKLPDPRIVGNAGSFFKNPVIGHSSLVKIQEKFPGVVFFVSQQSAVSGQQLNIVGATDLRPETGVRYKLAAGWLIEQCGWKGFREGDAGVHKDQALVLVNYGNATGKQISDLSEKIRQSVKDKFGIELEREVNIY